MNADELMMKVLLDLPQRLEKLQRELFEQRYLITALLNRAGLNEAGINRAFDLATDDCERITQELSSKSNGQWLGTVEGKQARQLATEEARRREKEMWREDCIENGRIYPDPTASREP